MIDRETAFVGMKVIRRLNGRQHTIIKIRNTTTAFRYMLDGIENNSFAADDLDPADPEKPLEVGEIVSVTDYRCHEFNKSGVIREIVGIGEYKIDFGAFTAIYGFGQLRRIAPAPTAETKRITIEPVTKTTTIGYRIELPADLAKELAWRELPENHQGWKQIQKELRSQIEAALTETTHAG